MRKTINNFALAITLAVLCAAAVVADDHKSATFTFSDDSSIYNTTFKRGEYKIRFYEGTNKVEVLKDNEVVLTTTGRIVENTDKADNNALLTTNSEKGMVLTGVRFKGERRTVMFNEPVAAETRSQNENIELFEQ